MRFPVGRLRHCRPGSVHDSAHHPADMGTHHPDSQFLRADHRSITHPDTGTPIRRADHRTLPGRRTTGEGVAGIWPGLP